MKAMLVTSFTTSVAFFSTAGSPIMPISTLGIWAGLLVIIQFLLVITVYPSALIIWERFWKKKQWWKRFQRKSEENEKRSEAEYRPIERFFNGPWTKLTYAARWPLVIVAAALIGVSIWLATKLETPLEPEKFLPDSNPIVKATDLVRSRIPENTKPILTLFG